jgi:hypothetical protein
MDDETRRFLVDTVFAPFESTGKETFRDILSLKGAETVLSSFFSLPKEKQKELRRLAGQLIQSGSLANRAKRPETGSEEEEQNKHD